MMNFKKNRVSLGFRINNPFNIRYSRFNHWLGQIGSVDGFARFISLPYGVRAFVILYRTYINKYHVTVRQFISRYAPASENNTQAYIRTVCRLTGFDPDYRLTTRDLSSFGSAVLHVEQGFVRADVVSLLSLY